MQRREPKSFSDWAAAFRAALRPSAAQLWGILIALAAIVAAVLILE